MAEAFVDAFYSWDAQALADLVEAGEDADRVLYYQAWAEAAHYRIRNRRPCQARDDGFIECAITVTDDFGQTLGYIATDTFRLQAGPERILAVTFEVDDPPVFEQVFAWMMATRPEVFAGPCRDMFAGGETPAACARAVAESARDFAAQGLVQAEDKSGPGEGNP